jgi:hypothetical protein
LIPESSKNRAERDAWATARLDGEGWTGVEIRRPEATDRVVFRTAEAREAPLIIDRWQTDGDRAALTVSAQGNLERAWARKATVLKGIASEGPLFRSDAPITFLAEFDAGRASYEVDSDTSVLVSFKAAAKPRAVLVDGAPAGYAHSFESGIITLTLAPGEHRVVIESRRPHAP